MIMIRILLHTEKKAPRNESKGFGSKWGSIMEELCDSFGAFYCNRF